MRFENFLDAELPALADLAGVLTANCQDGHDLLVHSLLRTKVEWTRAHLSRRPTRHAVRNLLAAHIHQRHNPGNRLPEMPASGAGRAPAADAIEADAGPVSLRQLLDQLPRTQRTVVALRFFLGYSDREIADAIGVPLLQAPSILSRALASLQLTPDQSERDAADLRSALAERRQQAPDPSQVRADLTVDLARRRHAAALMVAIAVVAIVATALTIVFYVSRQRQLTSTAPVIQSVVDSGLAIDDQYGCHELPSR